MNANFRALGMDTMLQSCSIYSSKVIIETMGGWTKVG